MQTPATACGTCAGLSAFPSSSPRHACGAPPGSGGFRKLPGPPTRAPRFRLLAPMASAVDSPGSSSNFAKRMERAWLISQGIVNCADCKGTGFRAKWLEEPPVN
ncbi:hypothetical protein EJB05_43058 [Eragrostis curvula]|uniref:Uncharacterized protein n=1 Tax=Eragrostis curvula TaxID=38414 RepID=A0A5J9TE35_9POAL|nr:hypothetical protein EJB05_43058 [Eragrostis curvula]